MKKTNTLNKKEMAARTTTAPAATPIKGNENIEKALESFATKYLTICLLNTQEMKCKKDVIAYYDESTKAIHQLKKPSFKRFLQFLGILDNNGFIYRGRLETASKLFEIIYRTTKQFYCIGDLVIEPGAVKAALKAN